MEQLEGRNPVLEALRAGNSINKIYFQKDATGSIRGILELARNSGAVLVESDKIVLDKLSEGRPHQGVIAQLAVESYIDFNELVNRAKYSGDNPIIVLLDHIEDPYNLGAILRSALAAGAVGAVIPKRRSAGLSPVVAKASAGAVAHLPVARVANLVNHVKQLKEEGYRIVAADTGGKHFYNADLTGPIALVIGGEGEGISRLLKENCDEIVSLPMSGPISSLNASVAAGIILYEMVRQRQVAKGE
ncbi:MAG: 23S rRNA (guanosine(2251)-2'-O)-methyltransferase RlmB [bacterium]|nr:23S rRNA (guanosine(2251)-2'-O)-methyltransferase RlmB [bacterium]